MTTTVVPATAADYAPVVALLKSNQLPIEDIESNLTHFFVAKEKNTVIASIGMEYFNEVGLLRSMATDINHRGKGIAANLVEALENYAASKKIKSIYLLTTTASNYFLRKGYRIVGRNEVPESIQQTNEFSSLCPSTAVVMSKEI